MIFNSIRVELDGGPLDGIACSIQLAILMTDVLHRQEASNAIEMHGAVNNLELEFRRNEFPHLALLTPQLELANA